MKICIVWEWGQAEDIYPNWRDGHRACFDLIGKEHEVDILLDKAPVKDYDWVLSWCDSSSNFSKFKSTYDAKRGLFLTTDPHDHENLKGFDVVFCESTPVYEAVRRLGIRAVKAFGTDSDFFCPKKAEKDIEYFYPACFSKWKMQSDIAYLGDKLLCVGTVQPDGKEQLASCRMNEVRVEIGYFPAEKIRNYYRRAKNVIIPAVHGSERTVLEAMSCNILPEVTKVEANKKTYSYIKEYHKSGLTPREFILKNYTASLFAEKVCKSLQ